MKHLSMLLLPFLCTLSVVQATEKNFFIDSFEYEDNVYSRSKKTELGDKTEIEVSAKYIYQPGTYARLRFETSPEENRENNETSKFEIQLGHQYKNLSMNLDLELQTNKSVTGGTVLGLDLDSEYTNINWKMSPRFNLTFYPFNFDGEVGNEFRTWDVTRIKTIEGSPTTVSNSPTGSEKIIEKTIPGFVFSVNSNENNGLGAYVGFGVASYFYPTNADFNLLTSTSVTSWQRKEDLGYKAGVNYDLDMAKMKIEFVGHDSSKETGSLLEYAGSFYLIGGFSGLVFDTEFTIAKAGDLPWYTPRGTTWFETVSPNRKTYSNYFGNANQSWLGKTDFGAGLRLGYEIGDVTPYLLYRYHGENFVNIETESAHILRTADETQSHGGLNRFGGGAYVAYGNWVIKPEFEVQNASNAVFGNAADETSNRLLSTYRKTDYQLSIFVNYDIDGGNLFRP